MSDAQPGPPTDTAAAVGSNDQDNGGGQRIDEPAKLIRLASMMNRLGAEAREVELDEEGRRRLHGIYDRAVAEIKDLLDDDLADELDDLQVMLGDEGVPSESELRIAQAQLMGWLDGLFRGIQAAFTAQQAQAQHQLGQLRNQQLSSSSGPGQYL